MHGRAPQQDSSCIILFIVYVYRCPFTNATLALGHFSHVKQLIGGDLRQDSLVQNSDTSFVCVSSLDNGVTVICHVAQCLTGRALTNVMTHDLA